MVLFEFSTDTKGEFRIFEIKILFFTLSTGKVELYQNVPHKNFLILFIQNMKFGPG